MGNDGGTIAKGRDLKAIFGDNTQPGPSLDDEKGSLLSTCALSSLPLYDGEANKVVSDYKGLLYIKEKMLEALLEKKLGKSKKLPHITGLDDILDLNITWKKGEVVCPLTGESQVTFAYLRPCGCVMSMKILSELRLALKVKEDVTDGSKCECPQCGKTFYFNYDVVAVSKGSAKWDAWNERNYKYVREVLNVSHAKKSKKRKRKEHKREVKKARES